MAVKDYYVDCQKLESKVVEDGLGGFETVEYFGISFKGLPTKRGSSEQLIGALRGKESIQYFFSAPKTVPLNKDDKIAYFDNGKRKFIRLTDEGTEAPTQSLQNEWKVYGAEDYQPTTILYEE